MSTKPTEYLNWNPSLSNTIDPPSGLKSTGYLPTVVPDSQHHNWIFNLCDQWIQWLDQITSVTNSVAVNSAYVVAAGVYTVLADSSSGGFSVTLPLASTSPIGTRVTVKNIKLGTNTVTLTPNGSDKIEGSASTFALNSGDYITVVSDGSSNWWQVG